jgi:hypothetical protein
MSAGWALVNSPPTNPKAWGQFTAATDAAEARYNTTYQSAAILAAEPKADNYSSSQGKG